MQRTVRAEAVLATLAFVTLHGPSAPAAAQTTALPLPGVAASAPPSLTVDAGLWSLEPARLHEAILTFDHHLNAVEVAAIEGAGLAVRRYRALPMVAVRGTGAQLRGLLGLPGLRSLFLDRPLESFPDESERVALTASSFASLVAYQFGPALHEATVASIDSPMSVADALEGFDWAFRNRLEYRIEAIANNWGTSADITPGDPIAVATELAHDAGMGVVFAAGEAQRNSAAVNRYSTMPGAIRATAEGTEP